MTDDEMRKLGTVHILRSPAMAFYEYAADNGKILRQAADALTAKDAEIAALKLQAQSWSMEAKAQKATVCECYQAATGAKGEPGDWNGARPIREALAERDAEIAALKEKVKRQAEALKPFAKLYAEIEAAAKLPDSTPMNENLDGYAKLCRGQDLRRAAQEAGE